MGFFILSGAMSAMPAEALAPTAPLMPEYAVQLTGYNAVPEQTDSDPFTTASGLYSNPEIVAARSRDLAEELPFGTVIEITGPATSGGSCGFNVVEGDIGYRIIADTMNARYTDRIDVLFGTDVNYLRASGYHMNASRILGICDGVTIRVVGRLDISKPGQLPQTQAQLAALIQGKIELAAK